MENTSIISFSVLKLMLTKSDNDRLLSSSLASDDKVREYGVEKVGEVWHKLVDVVDQNV